MRARRVAGAARRALGLVAALALAVGLAGCDKPGRERISDIYAFKEDPTPEHVDQIREALDDPDPDVRATAVHALVVLGVDDAREVALAALDDSDRFVRATAAKLIGDLGQPSLCPVLVERLERDPDKLVRQRVAEALGRLGGEAATRGLATGLRDPMENVRLAAVKGLRKLGEVVDREVLIRLAVDDPVWEVRVQALLTLGQSGDPAVVEALRSGLEDSNEFVRAAAANALRLHEEVANHPTKGPQ